MTALPCPHGMPNAAACLECMQDGPVSPPSVWAPVGEVFRAGFNGRCPGCDQLITVGQEVLRWDRGERETVYTHRGHRP